MFRWRRLAGPNPQNLPWFCCCQDLNRHGVNDTDVIRSRCACRSPSVFPAVLTRAVAVGGRLRDGAGQRMAASLCGMFVKFLLLITELNLLWRWKWTEKKREAPSFSAADFIQRGQNQLCRRQVAHEQICMSARSSRLKPLLSLNLPPSPATSASRKLPHHPLWQLPGCASPPQESCLAISAPWLLTWQCQSLWPLLNTQIYNSKKLLWWLMLSFSLEPCLDGELLA